jgi:hypothetical protein
LSHLRTGLTAAAAALALALAVPGGATAAPPAPAAAPSTTHATPSSAAYTVTVGSSGSFANPDDSPASVFTDKDGSFYYQESDSLYGATQPRQWSFYTGTDFDTATADNALDNANDDTTARCNNSPTGLTATYETADTSYAERNYCDLIGTWVDPDTGNWYGLVHNEFTPEPFGANSFSHYDAIDYAESTDQGKTWTIEGHAITSPYSTTRGDTTAFPNGTFDYGDGDPRLFVDTASGYFYLYYGTRIVPKAGTAGSTDGLAHVARAPISGKMATGTWQKWYDGAWSQPGVGGLESNLVPATSADPSGYTPVADDYNPANAGTVDQMIAAGDLPSKSNLFVMNIAYDAYLGLYIGAPEVVDTSTPAPQQYYVTDNLATQQWYLAGDTGGYTSDSWYRWFLDSANLTSSTIIGKTFRSYCAYACYNNSDGTYADITVDSSAPAAAPFSPTTTYRISSGDGRVLAQSATGSATTSEAAATGSALEAWSFASDGDGSYTVTNAGTGQLLGVGSTSTTTRAWGTAPTATAAGSTGPTVGQQWFVIPDTDPTTGAATGSYRLVNRYSGLVLGLTTGTGGVSETTPARYWTNTTGSSVGGSRTASEQTLTMTAVGTTSGGGSLNGTHTLSLSGQALDDPNWSTTDGVQQDTWALNGGANQSWVLTRQSDGSYQIENAYSNLCLDDDGGYTTAGTQVIQWPCTGNSNQHWTFGQLPNGAYTVANVNSHLLLTTSSTTNGGLVTQQTNTGSPLQQWTLG